MTDKKKLIAPRLPRGFEDRLPGEIAAVDQMVAKIRKVYERYGFDPVETPLFEYTETLGKFLPDTDRPNAGVFSLQDDDEQWMSLRYDLTAPLARHFAENFDKLPKPYRSYRQGYVFRNEKPGPGRFRQFMQFDADTVGAAGPEADAEMCMMMADTMDALGLAGKYVVKVNNRKVLDGVLEAASGSGTPILARSSSCCGPSTSWTGSAPKAWRRCWARAQGRERRLHQGRRPHARRPSIVAVRRCCATTRARGRRVRCSATIDKMLEMAGTDPRHRARVSRNCEGHGGAVPRRPAMAPTASASTPPSSAASNTTPARCSRSNSPSRCRTRRARTWCSARSAAVAATMGWFPASAPSRCRRRGSPSACRAWPMR